MDVDLKRDESVLLSIVIPAMNEEACIAETVKIISKSLNRAEISHEIIIVNDGSTDSTLEVVMELKAHNQSLRLISSRINQGHMNAISEGMRLSRGVYVCTIDADLQDPPESIIDLLKIIENERDEIGNSFDVIQTYRPTRINDTLFKRKTAALYYFILKRITGVRLMPNAADYRLITQSVARELVALPERNKVYRLLIPSLGFNIKYVEVNRNSRFAGKTKYSLKKMIELSIDSVVSFSNRPLRLIAYSGLLTALMLFFAAITSFFLWLFTKTVPGWTSLFLVILSSNALLFASIGIVGEYVGRIYAQNQNRPTGRWVEYDLS